MGGGDVGERHQGPRRRPISLETRAGKFKKGAEIWRQPENSIMTKRKKNGGSPPQLALIRGLQK